MSELATVEQIEELQSDIEDTAGAIYHAIDAAASDTRMNDPSLEDDVDEAIQYAQEMRRKCDELIGLLKELREWSGEEEDE